MAQDTCAPKDAKSKSFNKYKAWLTDGAPARKELGERIGGGWFVFKRNPKTGRIRPSQYPFEYAEKKLALEQADKLSSAHRDCEFIVLHVDCTRIVASKQVAS